MVFLCHHTHLQHFSSFSTSHKRCNHLLLLHIVELSWLQTSELNVHRVSQSNLPSLYCWCYHLSNHLFAWCSSFWKQTNNLEKIQKHKVRVFHMAVHKKSSPTIMLMISKHKNWNLSYPTLSAKMCHVLHYNSLPNLILLLMQTWSLDELWCFLLERYMCHQACPTYGTGNSSTLLPHTYLLFHSSDLDPPTSGNITPLFSWILLLSSIQFLVSLQIISLTT